jgi:hypothetical protein
MGFQPFDIIVVKTIYSFKFISTMKFVNFIEEKQKSLFCLESFKHVTDNYEYSLRLIVAIILSLQTLWDGLRLRLC